MLKYIFAIAALFTAAEAGIAARSPRPAAEHSGNVTHALSPRNGPNSCVSFTLGSGTGCQWMCNYCATNLGTGNYYFTDGVCTYQSGGCVGNPIAGKSYTCCAV